MGNRSWKSAYPSRKARLAAKAGGSPKPRGQEPKKFKNGWWKAKKKSPASFSEVEE